MHSLAMRVVLSAFLACAACAFPCLGQSLTSPARSLSGESAEGGRPFSGSCLSIVQAALRPNRDLCVAVHIYDVVELGNGTRFLDVCPPNIADAECGFTIVSAPADRGEVGDLSRLRNQDVHIRGVVRVTHGRMGLTLSHARQLRGGPEKFRPNPLLARDFDGQSNRTPVKDPNLSGSGRHRAFMNNREHESLPPGR